MFCLKNDLRDFVNLILIDLKILLKQQKATNQNPKKKTKTKIRYMLLLLLVIVQNIVHVYI